MRTANGARILCVDDEINVLEGLENILRRKFRFEKAQSGQTALEILKSQEPFAVVLSDMRMPGMDGAAFLGHVREEHPDTVRMLLTGHADMNAAISAVNQGQIFRFLTKPCPPDVLIKAFDAAVDSVARAAQELLDSLVTRAKSRNREVEAARARERAAKRFGTSNAEPAA